MHKKLLAVASLLGAFTVALGAFGAHSLKEANIPEDIMRLFETGVRYQFYHVLGMFISGIIYRDIKSKLVVTSGWFFTIGIFLFSGSLYFVTYTKAVSLAGYEAFGALTPVGGLSFIAGWICIAAAFLKNRGTNA